MCGSISSPPLSLPAASPGLAGALYGIFSRGVFADYVFWSKSAEIVIMTILGGVGLFLGSAGRRRGAGLAQSGDHRLHAVLVVRARRILLALLFGFPGGIVGGLDLLWQRLKRLRNA